MAEAETSLGGRADLAAAASDAANEELYRSDEFRMQSMKVLPCSKRYVHDWTECPFAHPQEKARRRDPRAHSYTGIACPSMKKEGTCAFGDHCPYAHNVFEYWLHPTRYRTQLCNDGSNCRRKICFFAHSLDELRVPACKPFVSPEALAAAAAASAADVEAKRKAATVGGPMPLFPGAPGTPPAMPPPGLPGMLSSTSVLTPVIGSSPQRLSLDSQPSQEEAVPPAGPFQGEALPGLEDSLHASLAQLAGAGFSSQEQQVIELVTGMLAQDRISAAQAASILQQMLDPGSLAALQSQLTLPRGEEPRRHSDPLGLRPGRMAAAALAGRAASLGAGAAALGLGLDASPAPGSPPAAGEAPPRSFFAAPDPSILGRQAGPLPGAAFGAAAGYSVSLEQAAALQAVQGMGLAPGGAAAGYSLGCYAPPRSSMESDRSSFDSARMSFEGLRGGGDQGAGGAAALPPPAFLPPRPSVSAAAALDSVPAPMYPQYWTGQQLAPIQEGMPMLSAPLPRRSNPWEAGDRLSADFGRLSFEARMPPPMAAPAPPPAVNPYASSLFAASLPAGHVDLRGLQRGAVAESPFTAATLLAGPGALNGAQWHSGAGAERAYSD